MKKTTTQKSPQQTWNCLGIDVLRIRGPGTGQCELPRLVSATGRAGRLRITVVRRDYGVLYDACFEAFDHKGNVKAYYSAFGRTIAEALRRLEASVQTTAEQLAHLIQLAQAQGKRPKRKPATRRR